MKNPKQKCVRCQEYRDISMFLGVDVSGHAIERKTCAICIAEIRTPKKSKEFIHCRPDSPEWINLNKTWIPTTPPDEDDENTQPERFFIAAPRHMFPAKEDVCIPMTKATQPQQLQFMW